MLWSEDARSRDDDVGAAEASAHLVDQDRIVRAAPAEHDSPKGFRNSSVALDRRSKDARARGEEAAGNVFFAATPVARKERLEEVTAEVLSARRLRRLFANEGVP